jgi:hypothetical protein
MILKHVHLFGLLLLSLLLASFLGKFLNTNSGDGIEGLENEGDDSSAVPNRHTGGSIADRMTYDAASAGPDDDGFNAPDSDLSDAHVPQGNEGFGNIFDSILPAGSGNSMEPFIAPHSKEGLANSGIPKSQIPPGQEHLYVLKTQVVPPKACPVCPTNDGDSGGDGGGGDGGSGDGNNLEDSSSGLSNGLGSAFSSNGGGRGNGSSKCPPCPACARCPEPSFDCKKVPNYSIGQNGSMSVPRPVLADFSQFGM